MTGISVGHPQVSSRRSHQTGHHSQDRGFASPIGSKKGMDFTGTQLKVEVSDDLSAAELPGNAESLDCYSRGPQLFSHRHRLSRERRTLQMVVDVVGYVNEVLNRGTRNLRVAPTKCMVGDRPEVDYRRPFILQTASLRPLDPTW
jgi:hypothetical protein